MVCCPYRSAVTAEAQSGLALRQNWSLPSKPPMVFPPWALGRQGLRMLTALAGAGLRLMPDYY